MRLKRFFIILFALSASMAFAQQSPEDDDERGDKIEALKVGFITEKLNLCSAEAKNFWPVYNEYESQMKKLRLKEKENAGMIKAKTSATDADADKFLADQLALKQQQLDLTKKYVAEFKKVISSKKVARLFMLEQEFKQQLLKRLKERRGNK